MRSEEAFAIYSGLTASIVPVAFPLPAIAPLSALVSVRSRLAPIL